MTVFLTSFSLGLNEAVACTVDFLPALLREDFLAVLAAALCLTTACRAAVFLTADFFATVFFGESVVGSAARAVGALKITSNEKNIPSADLIICDSLIRAKYCRSVANILKKASK